MTEFWKVIASFLNVPSGIVLGIAIFTGGIIKGGPLTFITSHHVEKALLTKEKRFMLELFFYLVKSICFSCLFLLFVFSSNFYDLIGNNMFVSSTIAGVSLILGQLIFVFFALLNDNSWTKVVTALNEKISYKWKMALFFIFFICFLIAYFYVNGLIVYSFKSSVISIGDILSIFIISFIFSLAIPKIFSSFSKYLQWEIKKGVYVSDPDSEKDSKESSEWFILYPINKEEVLLGDNPVAKKSKSIRIVSRDFILDKEIKVKDLIETNKVQDGKPADTDHCTEKPVQ
ncbi:hypothetical protein [Bacillus velezensis]|uniref:hypothetical protein n=1 Tax=Bacillus velezensis TaxID=492670 RepID=UPI000F5F1527|nr:hypothetical protein [Bacillus velezensis]AZI47402.1 hypothetical protein BVMH_11050 [Bacillus velezensis]